MKVRWANTQDTARLTLREDSKMDPATEYCRALLTMPLKDCVREIDPLSRGKYANEYNDCIDFFDKKNIALSDRLIKPYITSETHGERVFDDLYRLINNLEVETVLDLGCGAGEFLNGLRTRGYHKDNLFGCTIHLGEVEYSRAMYDLNIVPADMREIDLLFNPGSLDLIVAHCCLHFLVPEDRAKVLDAAHQILGEDGYMVIVDYKGDKSTGISMLDTSKWAKSYPTQYQTMGHLTLLRKL